MLFVSSNFEIALSMYCELYDTDQAQREFGSYALEIIEGRKTTEQDAQQTSQTNGFCLHA
jgi:hypothetical protein